jgi:hypothetical protein
MKKFIIILFLLLLFTSCNKPLNNYISRNIYERTYTSDDIVYVNTDVFYFSFYYGIDSIPLENWITNTMITDTINIEQKMIIKSIDEKTSYQFVLSKYVYPTILYYTFVIRYYGKEKDIYKTQLK